MGLWDKLFGELVDVIQWMDDSSDTMVYRFERYGNEIKYGAKLTVREGQMAVFVNQGEIADVFEPGMYKLETNNLPLLSTLQSWAHGFESPFKSEIYFCSTKRFTDLKWGTKNPIMLRDSEFGPVRLRAFGNYVMRVGDPARFIREIAGTDGHFTTDEITNQLRNMIVSRFTSTLGESDIPILDLAGNYDQLGEFVTARIAPGFLDYGLELTKLLVENISLPPKVEEALDKRTSMGIVGNLDAYLKFQTADALEAGASAPGGALGQGMGLGVGMAMAQQMGAAVAPAQAPPAVPPPLPNQVQYHIAIDGVNLGAMQLADIASKIAAGEISGPTLVWTQGMEQWRAASEIPAFEKLFAAKPPPLPPT